MFCGKGADLGSLSVQEYREIIKSTKRNLRKIKAEQKALCDKFPCTKRRPMWAVWMLDQKCSEFSKEYDRLRYCYQRLGIPELTLSTGYHDDPSPILRAELIDSETGTRKCVLYLKIRPDEAGPIGRYCERAMKYMKSRTCSCRLFMFQDSADFWAAVYEKVQPSSRPPFDRFFHRGRIYYFATLMKPSRGKKK